MSKYDLLWQQRELERLLSQMRPTFDLLAHLPPAHFENMRAFEDLSRRFTFPLEYLTLNDEILKSLDTANLAASLPSIYEIDKSFFGAFEAIQQQMVSTFSAIDSATSAMEAVSASIAESLAGAEAMAKCFSLGAVDIAVLLRAHDSFVSFALGRVASASGASGIFQKNTASAIAEAAQILPELSYVSELSALMAPRVLKSLIDLPSVNLFEELDAELVLVDLEGNEADVVAAVEGSSASRVVDVGGRLVQRVYEMNTEAERRGEKPLFKPTTKTMMAFYRVPSTVASEEAVFLEVVDALYFLLYEGSGDGARLTESFSPDRLEALWLLRHLRLGARHDLDHGKPKEVTKKARTVGEAYEDLIGVPIPKTKAEWQGAQSALYEKLAEMLDDLWLNDS